MILGIYFQILCAFTNISILIVSICIYESNSFLGISFLSKSNFLKSLLIDALSQNLVWLFSVFFIHIIFPSRSTSIIFDLTRYLKIVFTFMEFKLPFKIFWRSLTLVYSFDCCIVFKNRVISSCLISFTGSFLFIFLFFISS